MLWRVVYALATWLAVPFAFAYFAWRSRREPAYRRHWGERLGRGRGAARGSLWVHAASVGEMVLAGPLVEGLHRSHPDHPVLITTMTPSGRDRAQALFGERAVIRYMPLDSRGATRRFMRSQRPAVGVFVETELWPHLIAAAAGAQIPLVWVNASVSERSTRRYASRVLARPVRFMLRRIAAIGTASDVHAGRFIRLGAPRARVQVTGNLKYDGPDLAHVQAHGAALRTEWRAGARPVWVAASTHEGEEAALLEAFASVRYACPNTLLVIAPRHPQRFDTVAALLDDSPWRISRRSAGQAVDSDTDILLADTLGEVPAFYGAADVVFVGGSLAAGIGGHNVLEAAALARPLCVGPHIGEWREIVEALVDCGAARIGRGPGELAQATVTWLGTPVQARRDGVAGARHVHDNAGALERSLRIVDGVIAAR